MADFPAADCRAADRPVTDWPESIQIPVSLAGERVDRALSLLTGRSRSQTAEMVVQGCVQIDGAIAQTASMRLAAGSRIELTPLPAVAATVEQPDEIEQLDVLYADADVVVVNKPAGVVTHPGSGQHSGTLADALVAQYSDIVNVGQPDRPGIVHRLDRGTSGVLVCARNAMSYEALVEQISNRQVARVYVALVKGRPSAVTGTIDAPIGRDRTHRTLMTVTSEGRVARTHYRVVETMTHPTEASLLRCQLETGRTHQIRVHLASIGLSLLGDLTYGVPDPFGIGRPLLHAYRLTFRHPTSDAAMSFVAPVPSDLATALDGFGIDLASFN